MVLFHTVRISTYSLLCTSLLSLTINLSDNVYGEFFSQNDADKILENYVTNPSKARVACNKLGQAVYDELSFDENEVNLKHKPRKPAIALDKLHELFRSFVDGIEQQSRDWHLSPSLTETLKDCSSICYNICDPNLQLEDEDDEPYNSRKHANDYTSGKSPMSYNDNAISTSDLHTHWKFGYVAPVGSMINNQAQTSKSDINDIHENKKFQVDGMKLGDNGQVQRRRKWRILEPGET